MKALHIIVMSTSLLWMVVIAFLAIGERISMEQAAIIFFALFIAGMYSSGKIGE